MEKIGIFEMEELKNYTLSEHERVEMSEMMKAATKYHYARGEKHIAFLTLLENDFEIIPEGFTAVYMRDEECQVVPNALIEKVKLMSLGGFDHAPEDHELHLFIDRWTMAGQWLNTSIIELVCHWMDENL
jgi:hypothetical protein